MLIELGKYRNNINFIKTVYLRDISKKKIGSINSEIAVATGVPAIVVAYYIGEAFGFSDEVNEIISNLTKFYGYTGVKDE